MTRPRPRPLLRCERASPYRYEATHLATESELARAGSAAARRIGDGSGGERVGELDVLSVSEGMVERA
jgi:hypothetical protein